MGKKKKNGLFSRLISEGKIPVHARGGGVAHLILSIKTGLRRVFNFTS